MIIIADTGPLIALSRAGQLDLLRELYAKVVIPHSVYLELDLDTARPERQFLTKALDENWLLVSKLPEDAQVKARELALILGTGEADAICLAEVLLPRFLLIDERKGREIATRRCISVTGSLGVLLAAKNRGKIESVTRVIEKMMEGGYRIAPSLLDKVKILAGE
ncbi:hypothetical protein MNBD_GAMMA26-2549 [hydrothermal vent metagenome]|uniref:DUF3368 domain-containing protein n=1 Tax=hydrothermal vent metagenome TaxID=652676 RepID=A0A3B1B5N4_9ZZZZ